MTALKTVKSKSFIKLALGAALIITSLTEITEALIVKDLDKILNDQQNKSRNEADKNGLLRVAVDLKDDLHQQYEKANPGKKLYNTTEISLDDITKVLDSQIDKLYIQLSEERKKPAKQQIKARIERFNGQIRYARQTKDALTDALSQKSKEPEMLESSQAKATNPGKNPIISVKDLSDILKSQQDNSKNDDEKYGRMYVSVDLQFDLQQQYLQANPGKKYNNDSDVGLDEIITALTNKQDELKKKVDEANRMNNKNLMKDVTRKLNYVTLTITNLTRDIFKKAQEQGTKTSEVSLQEDIAPPEQMGVKETSSPTEATPKALPQLPPRKLPVPTPTPINQPSVQPQQVSETAQPKSPVVPTQAATSASVKLERGEEMQVKMLVRSEGKEGAISSIQEEIDRANRTGNKDSISKLQAKLDYINTL